ncbi:hypothetical protein QBC37DRAFT_405867 [Rhypophila decipiens]|uniref:Uncharacterized protein n=1 Tax=Rhypophila decipiens TaxID=261697 RepID=A0AAN6Y1U5_9PEZI|nr:hypothetical protein QBC37DRAFT_405867 [Rhypophila decipiens]
MSDDWEIIPLSFRVSSLQIISASDIELDEWQEVTGQTQIAEQAAGSVERVEVLKSPEVKLDVVDSIASTEMEAPVTSFAVVPCFQRESQGPLSLRVFLAKASTLQASLSRLDTLTTQFAALHTQWASARLTGAAAPPAQSSASSPSAEAPIGHFVELAYQASTGITGSFAVLRQLHSDAGVETARQPKTIKLVTYESVLRSFKASLLRYNSEQASYKCLLKAQIREGYLTLRPEASCDEVNRAMECPDWGMGIVKRGPVTGAAAFDKVANEKWFYDVNGDVLVPRLRESILDRVALLKGEVNRVEGDIRGLRRVHRVLEEDMLLVSRKEDGGAGQVVNNGGLAGRGTVIEDTPRRKTRERGRLGRLCCFWGGGVPYAFLSKLESWLGHLLGGMS